MNHEEEVNFGVKMTEVVCSLRDLDEDGLIYVMMELALSSNAEKIIDVIVAAQAALDGLKDMQECA